MKSTFTLFSMLFILLLGSGKMHAQVGIPVQPEDSILHHYSNGKISVIITPWEDGRREIQFYDLKGNRTYSMEEARLSYQVSVDLAFHKNGAVKEAYVFTNPGASMYMYSETIQFSSVNEPEWRVSKKTPTLTLDDASGKKYYWDKKDKQWKEQEVISCQPAPAIQPEDQR